MQEPEWPLWLSVSAIRQTGHVKTSTVRVAPTSQSGYLPFHNTTSLQPMRGSLFMKVYYSFSCLVCCLLIDIPNVHINWIFDEILSILIYLGYEYLHAKFAVNTPPLNIQILICSKTLDIYTNTFCEEQIKTFHKKLHTAHNHHNKFVQW